MLLEKSYEVQICMLNWKMHQIGRYTKLKDARDRDMSRLKESYEATIEEHEKISRDLEECKLNHKSEKNKLKDSYLSQIIHLEENF